MKNGISDKGFERLAKLVKAQEENWETGEAYNWIANDEGLYSEALSLARRYDYSMLKLGNAFQDAFEDILSSSIDNIGEVDWEAVASNFIEEDEEV